VLGADHPQLGGAGGGRRGQARRSVGSTEREELRKLRREIRQHPGKSDGLVRTGDLDPRQGFEFVKANRAAYRVATMCRVLGLSTSGGFYAWIDRAPSARAQSDAKLPDEIKDLHRCHFSP